MAGSHGNAEVLLVGHVPAELLRRFRVAAGEFAGSVAYGGALARTLMLDEEQRAAEFGAYIGWLGDLPRQSLEAFRVPVPLSLMEEWRTLTAGTQIGDLRIGAAMLGALEAPPLRDGAFTYGRGETLARWFACWRHEPEACTFPTAGAFSNIMRRIFTQDGGRMPDFDALAPAPVEPDGEILTRTRNRRLRNPRNPRNAGEEGGAF